MNNIHENSTSLIAPPMFVSIETQTISQSTSDASTQTTHDIYISTETYAVTSTTDAENAVTDEDIIKYLTRKKINLLGFIIHGNMKNKQILVTRFHSSVQQKLI